MCLGALWRRLTGRGGQKDRGEYERVKSGQQGGGGGGEWGNEQEQWEDWDDDDNNDEEAGGGDLEAGGSSAAMSGSGAGVSAATAAATVASASHHSVLDAAARLASPPLERGAGSRSTSPRAPLTRSSSGDARALELNREGVTRTASIHSMDGSGSHRGRLTSPRSPRPTSGGGASPQLMHMHKPQQQPRRIVLPPAPAPAPAPPSDDLFAALGMKPVFKEATRIDPRLAPTKLPDLDDVVDDTADFGGGAWGDDDDIDLAPAAEETTHQKGRRGRRQRSRSGSKKQRSGAAAHSKPGLGAVRVAASADNDDTDVAF